MSDLAWIQPYLTALRQTGVMSDAARQIGIPPSRAYARKSADADFAAAVAEAVEESIDGLEASMMRRAIVGIEKPVVYQGQLMMLREYVTDLDGVIATDDKGAPLMRAVLDAEGRQVPLTINEKSDALLMFGLKGRRKAYATDRQELTGGDGAPLLPQLSETERASRVAALVMLAQQRKDAGDDADML